VSQPAQTAALTGKLAGQFAGLGQTGASQVLARVCRQLPHFWGHFRRFGAMWRPPAQQRAQTGAQTGKLAGQFACVGQTASQARTWVCQQLPHLRALLASRSQLEAPSVAACANCCTNRQACRPACLRWADCHFTGAHLGLPAAATSSGASGVSGGPQRSSARKLLHRLASLQASLLRWAGCRFAGADLGWQAAAVSSGASGAPEPFWRSPVL
jgi:hypothetical protein